MGPGQKFLTWVRSAIYGLGLNLENFPKKCQIFQLFSLRVKKNLFRLGQKVPGSKASWLNSYLLQVKSKLGSGQGPSLMKTEHYFLPQALQSYQLQDSIF